ncbi:MAG: hypothetical protein QOG78_3682, partial [Rhodospirillaceae bacterium]|nr:hypothetical protein [Rhodospirillaceae bacterium]
MALMLRWINKDAPLQRGDYSARSGALPAKMSARTADVVVIGGGLHGCSTALHLALRGLKPILVEKDYAGRHASGVNAGGVRQLARHLAEIPLSIASMALWEKIEELVGDDCGFESHGTVLVAENEEELAGFRTRVEDLRL